MKILVLGSTGMAGHTIALYFIESGYDVTSFNRRNFGFCKNIIGDITDFKTLENVIVEGNYDTVINAVGILNQEAEENKHRAILINTYLPHFLAYITKNRKTKIIQMSTDCVFSGKDGNYTETSFKDGKTFYDRTKALGEIENNKDITFRNSIIGPDINENGIGLFNWFLKQEMPINGFSKVLWSGVSTLVLAKAMEKSLTNNISGLYNLVNNKSINKLDLLLLFNRHIKKNKIHIKNFENMVSNKTLINTRNDFLFHVPEYEDMIIEMKMWILNHIDLYPHYADKIE